MLAFAASALITALTFKLFEDAYEHGGIRRASVGLIVGAVVFTVLNGWLDCFTQGRPIQRSANLTSTHPYCAPRGSQSRSDRIGRVPI